MKTQLLNRKAAVLVSLGIASGPVSSASNPAKTIYTEIVINAPKEIVWQILTDFARYSEWNPFIVSVEGRAETGTGLKNTMVVNGKTHVFKPKVLAAEENKRLVWLGKLWFGGLFDGRHEFVLEEINPNQTRLVQREFFSGILSGVVLKSIRKATLENFQKMNEALKNRAETHGAF